MILLACSPVHLFTFLNARMPNSFAELAIPGCDLRELSPSFMCAADGAGMDSEKQSSPDA